MEGGMTWFKCRNWKLAEAFDAIGAKLPRPPINDLADILVAGDRPDCSACRGRRHLLDWGRIDYEMDLSARFSRLLT